MAIEKTKRLTVRWTPENLEKIEQKAQQAEVSPSRYVRQVALGERAQDEETFDQYDEVNALTQLKNKVSAIGNNVNQLARVANQSGSINPDRLEEIQKQIFSIKKRIFNHLL